MERAAFNSAIERIEKRYHGRTKDLARSARRWLWLGYAAITGTAVIIGAIGVALIWFGTSLNAAGVLMIIAGSLAVAYGLGQLAQLVLVHNSHTRQSVGKLVSFGQCAGHWTTADDDADRARV